jgi:hypothetical protein
LDAVKNGHPSSLKETTTKSGTISSKTGSEVDGAVASNFRTTDINVSSSKTTILVLGLAANTPLNNSNLMTVASPDSNIITTNIREEVIFRSITSQHSKPVGGVGLEALHPANFNQETITIQILVVAEEAEISIKAETLNIIIDRGAVKLVKGQGAVKLVKGQGAVTMVKGQEAVKCAILLYTMMTTEGSLHLTIRCTKKDGTMAHPITIVGGLNQMVECGSHLYSTRRDTKSHRCSRETCLSLSNNTTGISEGLDLDRHLCRHKCSQASNESKISSGSPANLKTMSITDSLCMLITWTQNLNNSCRLNNNKGPNQRESSRSF